MLGLLISQPGCRPAAEDSEPLNLILISLDTVRADRLSSYGYENPTTPRLDQFAESAVLFSNCLAQSTATAPSHMSLFTGQYVHRHGLTRNAKPRFPPATLASVMRDEGWTTAAFTGHGSMRAELGHGVGFDVFQSKRGKMSPSRNLPEVIPEALAWLDERPPGPFFLFVHGYDPHCPYAPPEPWLRDVLAVHGDPRGLSQRCSIYEWEELLKHGGLRKPQQRLLSDLYDAELSAADVLIGEFIDALGERDLLDRSIIVFTSDHGEVLGDRAWVGHTRMWEEELHVPLMIRFPEGQWSGRRSDPVQLVDVASTILAALELPGIPGMQGLDLMPGIQNGSALAPQGRMRLTQLGLQMTVRFDDRFKVLQGRDMRESARHLVTGDQVYDLEADPMELKNLINTSDGRTTHKELIARYQSWRDETSSDDELYIGEERAVGDEVEHVRMLESLGYTAGGDDE